MSNSGKRVLIKNIFSIGSVQIANYLFPFITIPIVSRIIGPDKFGVINFTSSFVAYFTLLIGFGFDLTATRRIAVDPTNEENRNKTFSEVFSAQCLLLLFSCILFTGLMFTVPQLRVEKPVAIFTFITCIATLMTQNWLFQAMQDLPKVAIFNFVSKIIFTGIILLTIHKKSDYIWQPLALSVSQILVALISFVWSIKRYKLKLYKVGISNILNLLWNERIFFFSLCVINLYTNTNIVVLGLFKPVAEVGYYTAGQKIISILQAIISIPLTQALFPFLSAKIKNNKNEGLEIVQKIIPVVFYFTLTAAFSIIGLSQYFIPAFYGIKFTPSIFICNILAFIPMIIGLGNLIGVNVILNLNMDKLFFKIICKGAIFSVLLNLILVTALGARGAALSWTLTELFNLTNLVLAAKKLDLNLFSARNFYPKYVFKNFQLIMRKKA